MLSFSNSERKVCKENLTDEEWESFSNSESKVCKENLTDEEHERLFPKHSKYLFLAYEGNCGGLGNQLFRFASMYGIGKPFGRKPIFKENQNCEKTKAIHESEGNHEIEKLFPVYASQIKYINSTEKQNETFYLRAFSPPFSYDNPQKYAISRIKEKYLKIDGAAFQSFKYFETRRTEIRQIFRIGQKLCKTVDEYKKELFGDDQSHKFCVYTRRGDFANSAWGSNKDFTEQGIEFGFKYLMGSFKNISVVLLGENKQFLKDLKINRQLIANVYLPKAMPRINDLAFSIITCDSLLITSNTSTWGWWVAYLMPDNATIFYDSKFGKDFPHNRENFLAEWVPIQLINGKMTLD
ncbi:hypothetical protein niasHT_032225 [Heterodera trifolii]|uniref:L-Fucosyltransferase n=1 Tax=Heterodera trifolii TaxID=157864 RepID=A0ABD2HZL3_9BILA